MEYPIKTFSDRKLDLNKLDNLIAKGTTPTAVAVHNATKRITTFHQRKVIIVITDGEPNNKAALIKEIAIAESKGISLIGIGLDGIRIKDAFKRFYVFQDDLSGVAMTIVRALHQRVTKNYVEARW